MLTIFLTSKEQGEQSSAIIQQFQRLTQTVRCKLDVPNVDFQRNARQLPCTLLIVYRFCTYMNIKLAQKGSNHLI